MAQDKVIIVKKQMRKYLQLCNKQGIKKHIIQSAPSNQLANTTQQKEEQRRRTDDSPNNY